MKIKSIYIDGLHNARNKTYNFGDITYLYGNNGVGKSTVLQAIQLALLGYIPGTAKNSREALLRHSPVSKIVVRLYLDDNGNDTIIERSYDSKGTKVNIVPSTFDLTSVIANIELPIFNFNDFVNQTANKLKDYFIKNILPTTDGDLDWKQILTDSVSECNFTDTDEIINFGLDIVKDLEGEPINQVIAANTRFKDAQSFNKSELQRLQNTVDSLIYYDDYSNTGDVSSINEQLLSCNAFRDALIKYNSAMVMLMSTKNQVDELQAKQEALGGLPKHNKLVQLLSDLALKQSKLTETVNTLHKQLDEVELKKASLQKIIDSKGVCPYTKLICNSMQDQIADMRSELLMATESSINLKFKYEQSKAELEAIIKEIANTKFQISEFDTISQKLTVLSSSLSNAPEKPNIDKTVEELDIEIDALTESKAKIEANIRYNATIENITKLKYKSELEGRALNCWVKKTDINGLQTDLMLAPFNNLANVMTDYIKKMYGREDIKAHFNISSKANSFSFGLIRDNVYIPYDLLSSGEKCLYSLALMICITNNGKSPLKLLLCDDMFDHLDSATIENTFATLKKINDIQFIFAGVKDCKNALDITINL